MLTLVEKVHSSATLPVTDQIALTSEERQRSLYRCQSQQGHPIRLNLKRGTILSNGDLLSSQADENGNVTYVLVISKPEPVLTVTAAHPLQLLKAAYHLGNRHVPLELTESYLRLAPDPVLRAMLEKMSVTVQEAIAPFHPETGAYHHHHD